MGGCGVPGGLLLVSIKIIYDRKLVSSNDDAVYEFELGECGSIWFNSVQFYE